MDLVIVMKVEHLLKRQHPNFHLFGYEVENTKASTTMIAGSWTHCMKPEYRINFDSTSSDNPERDSLQTGQFFSFKKMCIEIDNLVKDLHEENFDDIDEFENSIFENNEVDLDVSANLIEC
ncbi:hypothetical protein TNCV_1393751 [Trichonephila clavipes]|nr:hypothetical protein TNCV_1393751 [Trichonephila clavipes]